MFGTPPPMEQVVEDLERARSLGARLTYELDLARSIVTEVKHPALSLERMQDMVERSPHAVLFKAISDLHWRLGNYEDAKKALAQAIEHRANYAIAHYARSAADRDAQGAEATARKAVKIAPDLWMAWERLAELVLRADDGSRIEELMEVPLEIIRIEPRLGKPYERIIRAVWHGWTVPSARMEAVLDETIRTQPSLPNPVWTRAVVREKQGRIREAVADAEKACALKRAAGESTAKMDAYVQQLRRKLQAEETRERQLREALAAFTRLREVLPALGLDPRFFDDLLEIIRRKLQELAR